jgi:hypothetical protein
LIAYFFSKIMRKTIIPQLVMALLMGVGSYTFSSCSHYDDDASAGVSNGKTDTEETTVKETFAVPVALLSSIPNDEYGEAVSLACPKITSLDKASLAVVTGADLPSVDKDELKTFFDQGGVVLVMYPDANTDDVLRDELGDVYQPYTDETKALAYAFNNQDQYYILSNDSVVVEIEGEEELITDEQFASLEGKQDENEDALSADAEAEDATDVHEHNENYYYDRISMLIEWVNDKFNADGSSKSATIAETRSGDGYTSTIDVARYYEQVTCSKSLELHHRIDKATGSSEDRMDKDVEIAYTYYVYPLYLFKGNSSTSAAGDYYAVKGSVTARNGSAWGPTTRKHGWCNIRMVGYYMRWLNIEFQLLNKDGTAIKELQFYGDPIPQTTMGSTTYTDTESYGFNLAGSVKGGNSGVSGGGTVGFSAQWSTTISQNFPDVTTQRYTDGSGAKLKYSYTVQNINSDNNWGNWDRKYPLLSRSDFTAQQAWIWKVPAGDGTGVGDNTTTSFKMSVKVNASYGVHSWWRGAAWSRNPCFDVAMETATFDINPPSRKPFGVVGVKNAGTSTVANIVLRNNGNNDVSSISGSYNQNEIARTKVESGTYTITYDLYNPDTNKKLSSWKIQNVKVELAGTEEESTTNVSTVNATCTKTY